MEQKSQKILDSQHLTDADIKAYAQELAGNIKLEQKTANVFTADIGNGQKITLRKTSTSQAQTGAR